MTFTTLELTESNGIARLTLNRPERKNAINLQCTRELKAAGEQLLASKTVKAVILTGRGDAFSVGGDITEFVAERHRLKDHILQMTEGFHAGILALDRLEVPVVVGVNGIAAGGGFSLALHADLTVAKRSAKLVSAYTRSGLTPDGGGTWQLPRLVGRQRAFDLMATNPTLTAEQAQQLGLIARVVDDDRFEAELTAVTEQLVALPTGAAGKLRKLIRESDGRTLAEQFEAEAQSLASIASTPETIARLEAFLKR